MTTGTLERTEPTPEFDQTCLGLVQRWQAGSLPAVNAIEELTDLARDAEREGHAANHGRAHHLLGYIQHYLGNLNISILHYERARQNYVRANSRRRVAVVDINQGENYRFKGEFKRASRLYHSAYETAQALDDLRLQSVAVTNEGLMLLAMKDYVGARVALQQGYELSLSWPANNADDLPGLQTEIFHGLATIDLAEKHHETAWENARRALHCARKAGERLSEGYAFRILGDVMTELDQPVDADMPTSPDDYYQAALDAFMEIGAEGEAGRTVFCRANSLARRGRRRSAAKLFLEAMSVFTRLDMRHDAARAAEAQLDVLT